MTKIYHTPDMPACPTCGHPLTGHARAGGPGPIAPPEPGDVLLCAACGAVLLITPDRTLQVLRVEELEQHLAPADVEALLNARRAIQRRNRADLH